MKEGKSGTLFIISTPIGNLKDITLRALEILSEVDLIAAEDTRRTRKLTSHYNIHKPLISYHEHSSMAKEEEIIASLKQGKNIALVTDAGTPGFSDPGFRLIRRIIEEKIKFTVIPGPSAILTALLLSGFSPTPFVFLGFPPAGGGARKAFFDRYGRLEFTRIIFESPLRLIKTLEEIARNWENPRVCVARELTKIFEETVRGTAIDVAQILRERGEIVKGEITLVVEGARIDKGDKFRVLPELNHFDPRKMESTVDTIITEFIRENPSKSTREIAREIANFTGVSRSKIYKRIIELRRDNIETC